MTKELFPVWNEKYERMGVTPYELYLRQNGLCWLIPKRSPDGSITVFCTDGKDEAETAKMLNPTFECAKCISSFAGKAVKDAIEGNKPEIR